MTPTRRSTRSLKTLSIAFLVIVALEGGVTAYLACVSGRSSAPAHIKADGTFLSRLSDAYSMRLWMRKPAIELYGWLKYHLLSSSSSSRVLVGKDQWLYVQDYVGRPVGYGVEDYLAVDPFSDAELSRWHEIVETWVTFLKARGIPLLIAVGPNKQTIYPEFLPSWIPLPQGRSRLAQFKEIVSRIDGVEYVDLVPALLANKEKLGAPLYFKTDSHWNDLGAAVASREILNRLRGRYPSLEASAGDFHEIAPREYVLGDLSRFLGLNGPLEANPSTGYPAGYRMISTTPDQAGLIYTESSPLGGKLPSALVFHDSLSLWLRPFLGGHISHAAWKWSYEMDENLVEQYHPTVVVFECIERLLSADFPTTIPLK